MDKTVFANLIAIISNAYMNPDYVLEKTLTTWYEFLKDIPEDRLRRAIENWVSDHRDQPTIADIKSECVKIRLEEALRV